MDLLVATLPYMWSSFHFSASSRVCVRVLCRFRVSNSLRPMVCSPPGSTVHGILQARILEWVAMTSSRGSYWPRDWTFISCIAGGFFTPKPPGKPTSRVHFFSPSDMVMDQGWTPGSFDPGWWKVLVSELAILGCNPGFIFALLTHLVSSLCTWPHSRPISSSKEGRTHPASYLLSPSSTEHSQQYEYSGLHIGWGVLTTSLDDCGDVGLWSILRVSFSLLLVSRPIPVADSFWYLAKLIQLCKV